MNMWLTETVGLYIYTNTARHCGHTEDVNFKPQTSFSKLGLNTLVQGENISWIVTSIQWQHTEPEFE